MRQLPNLVAGDHVAIVAPASRSSLAVLENLQNLLCSWQLECKIPKDIFGDDLLCAHNDAHRYRLLKKALQDEKIKAVICVRGGYGSMRLLPELSLIEAMTPKIFVGMSDITALHLFLQKNWSWPVIHGSLVQENFSPESIATMGALLFGETQKLSYRGLPLNEAAQKENILQTTITGGNLTLVQTSIGTSWQVEAEGKTLFLEEINERGYRVDRMLQHLSQAGVFTGVDAVLFGDFIGGEEPNGQTLIPEVLAGFAKNCPFPVVKVAGIGHGFQNAPLLFGTATTIQLGQEPVINNYRN